jgi:hypothetical protein
MRRQHVADFRCVQHDGTDFLRETNNGRPPSGARCPGTGNMTGLQSRLAAYRRALEATTDKGNNRRAAPGVLCGTFRVDLRSDLCLNCRRPKADHPVMDTAYEESLDAELARDHATEAAPDAHRGSDAGATTPSTESLYEEVAKARRRSLGRSARRLSSRSSIIMPSPRSSLDPRSLGAAQILETARRHSSLADRGSMRGSIGERGSIRDRGSVGRRTSSCSGTSVDSTGSQPAQGILSHAMSSPRSPNLAKRVAALEARVGVSASARRMPSMPRLTELEALAGIITIPHNQIAMRLESLEAWADQNDL